MCDWHLNTNGYWASFLPENYQKDTRGSYRLVASVQIVRALLGGDIGVTNLLYCSCPVYVSKWLVV